MNCQSVLDNAYEALGDSPLPLVTRLEIALHLLFCPYCADKIARMEAAVAVLRADSFPPAPGLGAAIMARLSAETAVFSGEDSGEIADTPVWIDDTGGGVPLRGWVITGLVILISLTTAFFGMDFEEVAAAQGMSFLLPVGITIGAVVTGYGALFIGSHLKELANRFNLR